jgi:hypothetical protein
MFDNLDLDLLDVDVAYFDRCELRYKEKYGRRLGLGLKYCRTT